MIPISLNEIFSETKKAVRSVNIDWGTAHDTAILSRWLAHHEISFLGSLLKSLELISNKQLSLNILSNNNKKPLSTTLIGILLVEYVCENQLIWKGYIDNPIYLVAAMGIISYEQQVELELKDKNHKLIAYTQNKELFFDFKSNIPLSGFVYLSFNKNKSYKNLITIDISNIPIIPMVNKKCWEKLKAMAFKTYVPESNKSRISGAGY